MQETYSVKLIIEPGITGNF